MKLHEKNQTYDRSGGLLHIIKPDGFGGFASYKIAAVDLIAGSGSNALTLRNVTGYNYVSVSDNTYVDRIAVQTVSGTPTIAIGTTEGGTDILDTTDVGVLIQQRYEELYVSADSIYFTITGGNVNIRVDIINNFI